MTVDHGEPTRLALDWALWSFGRFLRCLSVPSAKLHGYQGIDAGYDVERACFFHREAMR